MVNVKTNKDGKTFSLEMDGCLGDIYRKLALVITTIANNEELEMSDQDVIDCIKDEIEMIKL